MKEKAKDKTFSVLIPKEKHEEILEKLGYRKHPKPDHGYVRDIAYEKRWHAYSKEETIEVHLDKKINNRHVIMSWGTMMSIEKGKFEKTYRKSKQKPPPPPNPNKKKFKPSFAPNLLDLQKQPHEPPIIVPKKKTLLTRLLEFLKTKI